MVDKKLENSIKSISQQYQNNNLQFFLVNKELYNIEQVYKDIKEYPAILIMNAKRKKYKIYENEEKNLEGLN